MKNTVLLIQHSESVATLGVVYNLNYRSNIGCIVKNIRLAVRYRLIPLRRGKLFTRESAQ